MPLLELKSVSVGYGRNRVLQNVNLTLEHGEIVTLLGGNGAGKSTLVKSISGLLRPEGGTILLDGEPIEALLPAERLRRGIAHVPEGRQIFAGMTVAENLELGAYASEANDHAERLEFVWTLFPILRERMKDIAGNFSGGQQQMLAIARGLMSKPRIFLLDEPSLGVAPLLVGEIFRLITALARARHHHSACRAECAAGVVDRRPRLRLRKRQDHACGPRDRFAEFRRHC